MTEAEIRDYVEDLAATMLASTIGVEFDPGAAWDERKRVYEMSNLIVDSLSVTAAAEGAANGDWTCAVAAAVFRFAVPAAIAARPQP
jgi:arginine decarboxylase